MPSKATVDRWMRLVERCESSGLSVRAFAEQVDVNANTLAWWRSHLRRSAPAFVEVSLPVTSPVLSVELVDRGLRIEVPVGADLGWLRSVVEALC